MWARAHWLWLEEEEEEAGKHSTHFLKKNESDKVKVDVGEISALPLVWGYTDPRDVYAITQLHAFLGMPLLPGWIPGGDPCGPPSWLGVECVNANITAMDLSDNHIGGPIPTNLPITLRNLYVSDLNLLPITELMALLTMLSSFSKHCFSMFFCLIMLFCFRKPQNSSNLSDNQFTGRIPDTLSSLGQLLELDLSGNSLTNELPSSMGNLSSLITLHLQNNQLSGVLDVLQDLPLTDLRAGNPFNTTVIPSPPASPPLLSPAEAPSTRLVSEAPAHGQSVSPPPESRNSRSKITWIAIGGLLVIVLLVLGLCFSMSRCYKRRKSSEKTAKRHDPGLTYGSQTKTAFLKQGKEHNINITGSDDNDLSRGPLPFPLLPAERVVADPTFTPTTPKGNASKVVESAQFFTIASLQQYTNSFSQENLIGKGTLGTVYRAQLPDGKVIEVLMIRSSTHAFTFCRVDNATTLITLKELLDRRVPHSYKITRLVACLPPSLFPIFKHCLCLILHYMLCFPEDASLNLQVLAVKKLDISASGHLSDPEFLKLVSSISKLRLANIVELVGYCLEHGQRLLVYNYCRNGSLDEALNVDDEINKKLSWNARIRLALQAAKALEYLHEVCQPPIVHRNFKSCNVLLEDDLAVRVSDCGLAPLLSTSSMTQLQGSGYGAPELEFGSYSYQSDVYSFGVVMLRLLTGRKSYDRLRPRGEQYLVRWAFSRLHDIDALSRMVDPSLNGAYPSKSLSRVADIISLCIQPEPEFRPPMSEIVQKLLNIIQRDPYP
ncbi:hypothetical protein DH2020_017421 [Rehmannia glutinosa]|uniref:Protein kinase domain-containing protein n=1 Tax=Rehmannia glutinosa TaxID=99300 RepID=A0ABR0WTI8_REHGL